VAGGPARRSAARLPKETFLGGLSSRDQDAVYALGTPKIFAPGEIVLRQGSVSRHMYVLVAGGVEIFSTSPNGHTVLLDIRSAGDVVGELALGDGKPRVASVVATAVTEAIAVTEQAFLELVSRHPHVALGMIRDFARKLRWASERRTEAESYPVFVRVASLLLELFRTKADDAKGFAVPLAQAELAARVGSSGPAIHKALRELRDRGAIETRYRQIIVQDAGVLARIVHAARQTRPEK
jgi:CRP/FNR family transcriptional regulator, cyclic AMP receptor protein